MNQAQRKFLIDKIEANVKRRIEEIKNVEMEQPPSLENFFYGLALTGKLEIQPQEHIKKVMTEKAMKHTSRSYGESWLGSDRGGSLNKTEVKINVRDLFVVPKEYDELWLAYKKAKEEQDEKIRHIRIECETLVTRIQLASDKTLDKMISEIDDMGDISLMDTKLRGLGYEGGNKLIEK